MRINSGKDEGRDNLRDPTLKERSAKHRQAKPGGRTSGLGSADRKSGP